MRKPAYLASKNEAVHQLIEGEVFYLPNSSKAIHYDPERRNPFREGDNAPLDGAVWNNYSVWEIETENQWWEDLKELGPILCFVGNEAKEDPKHPCWVESYNPRHRNHFFGQGRRWLKAIPVKPEDLYQGE